MASVMFFDRTSEFQNIYLSLKQSSSGNGMSHEVMIPIQTLSVREHASRFNSFAQTVTQNLTSTHEMLENLTLLVRGAGQGGDAFEDTGQEIGQLTTVVKQRLSHLHRDIEQLSALMDTTRKQVAGKSKQCSEHSDLVVSSLRMRLMSTTKEFKDVLNTRTEALSGAHKRRSRYSYDREEEGQDDAFGSVTFRGGGASSAQGQEPLTSSLLLAPQANSNAAYYRSRTAAVRQIEATVHELSTMFQDFTRLMQEQESLIHRIDDDVTDSLRHVKEGQGELLKYLSNISSNRGLILKVFGILFVFVLFFGLFVVR